MAAREVNKLQPRQPPSSRDKFRRGVWNVVAAILIRPSPRPFHAWRRLILRSFGATIGPRVAIYPGARIWAPWNLRVEAGATIGDATLYNVAEIVVEASAVISQGAHLCTASHDHNSPDFSLVTAGIVLRSESWVGADAFIGPGVEIGEAAIAGARAVVFRSVPDRAIVVGNPAKVIASRSPEARTRLPGRF